jgi:hypothetical protein
MAGNRNIRRIQRGRQGRRDLVQPAGGNDVAIAADLGPVAGLAQCLVGDGLIETHTKV